MRLCPTVEGSPSPLITHRIAPGVCLARQRTNFHKCHKCVYRGKAVDWQAEEPAPLELQTAANGRARNGHAANGSAKNGSATRAASADA